MLACSIEDTQCGLKFFNRKVAKQVLPKVKMDRFAFDIEFLARTRDMNFIIGSKLIKFKHVEGSTINFMDGFRYALDILAIWDKLTYKKTKKY